MSMTETWTCTNCGDPLSEWDEPGFPCEDCTKCQPMDGWYSSWPKISEDDPRYKDIPLAPECYEADNEVASD